MGITDESVRITLRLPEILRDSLLQLSRENRRSMNSEIVSILELYADNSRKVDDEMIDDLLIHYRSLSNESIALVAQLVRLLS